MGLETPRNIALIYFILIAMGACVAPGAMLFLAIKGLRILKRRKIIPGSVLLKYFRNIACGDLYALFPNARVVMSNFDRAFLGVPAIAGGIPIQSRHAPPAQTRKARLPKTSRFVLNLRVKPRL